ncbi:phospholipid:diacylglycerol acyltransferase 1 [Tanacetum coccineum]
MSLDNETGLDLPEIRVRPVSGPVAADYIGAHRIRGEKHVRDQSLSRMKNNIELMVATRGEKVVVILHSMGILYFLHFMKWVEAPAPMGGGGGADWCAEHIKAVTNIGGPFLVLPKSVAGLFSAEAKDIAVARAVAPDVLDLDIFGMNTIKWELMMKHGGAQYSYGIADNLDDKKYEHYKYWSNPLETRLPNPPNMEIISMYIVGLPTKRSYVYKSSPAADRYIPFRIDTSAEGGNDQGCLRAGVYSVDGDETVCIGNESWKWESMMKRGGAHYSYGIADNLDDKKYEHHKYLSNPLETRLPNAPYMEIFSMYGVGLPTERSYVYKSSLAADGAYIPLRFDHLSRALENGSRFDRCFKKQTMN